MKVFLSLFITLNTLLKAVGAVKVFSVGKCYNQSDIQEWTLCLYCEEDLEGGKNSKGFCVQYYRGIQQIENDDFLLRSGNVNGVM